MTSIKLQLLAAAAATAMLGGTAAQAQFAIGATSINGAGASLPQDVVRQSADCFGQKYDLGFGVNAPGTAPASKVIADFDLNTPVADTIGNRFNCAGNSANPPIVSPNFGDPRIVQPNVIARYISTGSGTGVTSWLRGQLIAVNSSGATVVVNTSTNTPSYSDADGYQFSVSETALSSSNITFYNGTPINPFGRYASADTPANLFGAAIQVPVIVAAVAIAYDPVYAKVRNADSTVTEYRFTVTGARPDGSGGLKLTRAQYCGILNGTIVNWNQLPATVVKRDVNDTAAFDVPIRLVGRSETSGTSSLFTRAIAAQCTGLSVNTGIGGTAPSTAIVNKFGNSENRLPYDGIVTVAGTAYTGAAGTVSPTNSLSGAFFDKASQSITIGTEAQGLFTVANGNDGVAGALNLHPAPGATPGDRTLNGRIGYASPEQLLPATTFTNANSFGLNSASLQVNGTGTAYAAPDAKNATAAFGGIQPPQSKGTAGAYCTDAAACPTAYGDRANPRDWVQAADKSVSLAAPTKGYPIVGTSNVLLYTCYATPQRRQTVNGYVGFLTGKTVKDFNNQTVAATLIVDPVNGLFAKNGLAGMPAGWRTAIAETFLKSSAQLGTVGVAASKLGLRNLWIQDKIPTTPTGAGATTAANSLCAGKPGA